MMDHRESIVVEICISARPMPRTQSKLTFFLKLCALICLNLPLVVRYAGGLSHLWLTRVEQRSYDCLHRPRIKSLLCNNGAR